MQLRKRSSALKRRLWESEGASEVEAKTYEKLEAILGAPNEAPRRLEVDLAPPCAVFRRMFLFSMFFSFSEKELTRISEVTFDSAGSIVEAYSCFFS